MEAYASDSGTDRGGGQGKEPYLAKLFKRLVLTLDKTNYVLDETLKRFESSVPQPSQSATSYLSEKCLEIKKEEKVKVEVKCTFMKINDIDTVDQQFEAEIFIQAKWEDPLLDGLPVKSFSIVRDDPAYDHTLVVNLWRFKGLFKENLELENFPLDVQDLTISISTERSNEEIELIEDQRALSYVNTKAFMDAQEWSLYEHVETYRDNTTVEYASATIHPIIHAQCRVCRKVGYFIWNIIFIVVSILTVEPILTVYLFSLCTNSHCTPILNCVPILTVYLFLVCTYSNCVPTLTAFGRQISCYYYTFPYCCSIQTCGKTESPHHIISHITAQNATIKTLAKTMEVEQLESYDRYSIVSLAIIFFAFHLIFGIYLFLTNLSSTVPQLPITVKQTAYKSQKNPPSSIEGKKLNVLGKDETELTVMRAEDNGDKGPAAYR
ncbi:hypothetical protein KUTeg_004854 [Tegillarca granosa]|uniref:Uncharacterized protein n=1 Tax=Tegillarca granosa TaxID=220873 RepID=A0ABQ9FMN3_TEGGR|nr:hypothetical protein KUTeg_004854 [Tegillarca granosa]